ncbi:MAG: capsule assembly Wzi family protein [Phycisphaerales bacterium]|nr:MAG: capsule assembly Wzi family protein [Phycisphaerales bacterium]
MSRTLAAMAIIALASPCSGFVSTNVPLDHWSYDAVDKLIGQGLIRYDMLTTKPVSRLEMARLIAEAIEEFQKRDERNGIVPAILDKLRKEFKAELITVGILDGESIESFVKPIEDPYIRYVFASKKPDLENQRGDVFEEDSNYRLGLASRVKFSEIGAIYLHPEYANASSGPGGRVELVEAYGKLTLRNLEVAFGRDSLWWGPSYHGSMLMSNNAEPFTMLKISNPRPVLLPWILRQLGPFKAVWFASELGRNRVIPKPKLTGLRLNFKPRPALEIGMSRTIIFGGWGVPDVGLDDYLAVFWPVDRQAGENQLASFDASLLLPLDRRLPAKSILLYTEVAGEDAAGLSSYRPLVGIRVNDLFHTGRTDLRIEYVDNRDIRRADLFYRHNSYPYTYNGRVIGHHMGTDARDLFIRLTHYLTADVVLGLEYDRERADPVGTAQQTAEYFGFDLTFFTCRRWQLRTAYRYERTTNTPTVNGDNHIFDLNLVYDF